MNFFVAEFRRTLEKRPVPALAYMRPPNYNNWLSIFWRRRHLRAQFSSDFFSLVVALNNNRHTSARAQKIFTLPNMRPLSIREPLSPPERGVRGVLPPALETTSEGGSGDETTTKNVITFCKELPP